MVQHIYNDRKPRLAVLSTHPIQYNAPLFRMLTARGIVDLKLFYTWNPENGERIDPGFGMNVKWDSPLLDGYVHHFSRNISSDPGSHGFFGIRNPDLNAELAQWEPDAILIYGWRFHSHLSVMRRFHGKIPVWFRGDSHLLDEQPGLRTLLRRVCLRWVYQHVDRAFYCGQNNRAYFEAHGLKASQLTFMPHCVDNAWFSDRAFDGVDVEELRKELGFSPDQSVLMFVGKMIEKKNPEILLEAMTLLPRDSRKRLGLLFVGAGALENKLKTMAKSIESNIGFLPFQNQTELPHCYRLADLLALPSRGPGETWGLVVNEAMACGTGVLISDRVGCAPDLVIPEKTGFAFPSGDVTALLAAMEKLSLLGRPTLKTIGINSRSWIESWSLDNACLALEEAF